MTGVETIRHDQMCCDTERPHVHVGEQPDGAFLRLALLEWRAASLDDVLAAASAYLARHQEPDHR